MMTIDGDEPRVEKFLLLAGQHVITCVHHWWRGATEGYTLTVILGYFYLGAARCPEQVYEGEMWDGRQHCRSDLTTPAT